MGHRLRIGVVLGVLVASLAVAPHSFGTTGAMVLTADRTLTEDHQGTIYIAASATLDCAGHSVTSATPGTGMGISTAPYVTVTIRNCRVSGFGYGIFVSGLTHGSTIVGNVAADNLYDGIYVGGSDNEVGWNRAMRNESGIYTAPSTGDRVEHNVATDNEGAGISTFGVQNATFSHNVASGNRWGFTTFASIELSFGNTFTMNVANGNTDAGFSVYRTTASTFAHNVANGNGSGFWLSDYAGGNTLTKNVANANREYGIRLLASSNGNTVSRCAAHANGTADAADATVSHDNTWLRNSFGSFVLE